jgi:hypothetical protein
LRRSTRTWSYGNRYSTPSVWEKVFEEQISSRKVDRPQLQAALDYCREGDPWWCGSSTGSGARSKS